MPLQKYHNYPKDLTKCHILNFYFTISSSHQGTIYLFTYSLNYATSIFCQ